MNDAARPAAMISVQGLGRSFGSLRAVSQLDFEVAPGELFGLVGPDGAGKTTTLRMLAGVLKPTEGDAVLDGKSVRRDPEAVKQDLAYMSQRFGLYTDLTVRENLDFYADLYRVPRAERAERLERLYEFSQLRPFADRLAGALSGGMKQKLGLSCALIHQPRILLLDEPTFGVDPISRRELWRIVHEMVEQGVTAVVSTAYLDEAERFDRLALLHGGRLLAVDTPQGLVAALDGVFFEVKTPTRRELREELAGLPGIRSVEVFGEHLHVWADDASRGGVLGDRLRAVGIAAPVERVAPSLEDVFMARVGADPTPIAAAEGSA
jgi:ABC-2 type transport system ATP-binding protein